MYTVPHIPVGCLAIDLIVDQLSPTEIFFSQLYVIFQLPAKGAFFGDKGYMLGKWVSSEWVYVGMPLRQETSPSGSVTKAPGFEHAALTERFERASAYGSPGPRCPGGRRGSLKCLTLPQFPLDPNPRDLPLFFFVGHTP